MGEIQTKTYKPGMPKDGTYHFILTCCDCLQRAQKKSGGRPLTPDELEDIEFVWKAADQIYFQEHGYNDPPTRCRKCHGQHKRAQRTHANSRSPQPPVH